jgi:hypothetical protein
MSSDRLCRSEKNPGRFPVGVFCHTICEGRLAVVASVCARAAFPVVAVVTPPDPAVVTVVTSPFITTFVPPVIPVGTISRLVVHAPGKEWRHRT